MVSTLIWRIGTKSFIRRYYDIDKIIFTIPPKILNGNKYLKKYYIKNILSKSQR